MGGQAQSKTFSLNSVDYKKIFKGAVIAVVGALVPYLLKVIGNIDFGQYTVFVGAFSAVVANTILKYIND